MTERDDTDPEMGWSEYLAAAQRLDVVRRGRAAAVAEQERLARAARDELAGVRARLAPQHARLRELGAADGALVPGPAELAAAAHGVGPDPGQVLAALRQARITTDAADAAVVAGDRQRGGALPWLRNLLVYGPFAAVVLVVQFGLYLAVGDADVPVAAVLCGLGMAAAAFGLGWLTVGLVFPTGPDGRAQRTPLAGVVVCLAPVALSCAGAGVLAFLR